ncbi:MAG: hypothetical protein N3G75_02430 [Methanothrix sp.]|nr:hypothetical protein [Methanothrix sp.]MCX8206672.1 hypothetical protein [Methanothrix sp.]
MKPEGQIPGVGGDSMCEEIGRLLASLNDSAGIDSNSEPINPDVLNAAGFDDGVHNRRSFVS